VSSTICGTSSTGRFPIRHINSKNLFLHLSCLRVGLDETPTGNFLSSAVAVRQKTHVFSAFGRSFVGLRLRVDGFWSRWRISVDVDELGCLRHDRSGWFQGGTRPPAITSVIISRLTTLVIYS
jgi:hypothetical protein